MLDFIVVIDFEATCDANQRIGEHVNQIIEFAAVRLNLTTGQTVSTRKCLWWQLDNSQLPQRWWQFVTVGRSMIHLQFGTFHSFCQPTGALRVLSQYCLNLTGVSQAQVDAAPEFPQVLRNFDAWLSGYNNRVIDHTSAIPNNVNWIMASDSSVLSSVPQWVNWAGPFDK